MFKRLGLLGVNAQLAACVSVMILVIETIVILPSIIMHFNHTLEREVERQLMLHHLDHLAEYGSLLARPPSPSPTPIKSPPLESPSQKSPYELLTELSDEGLHGSVDGASPYISIHNDRNLVAKTDDGKSVWMLVASLSGLREEWHVKHFAATEFAHMPLFSLPSSPLATSHANVHDLDDMHVQLRVPPEFMRSAMLDHAIERGGLVLAVLLLAGVGFYFLVQCKVIRPLRQILDKIAGLGHHADQSLAGATTNTSKTASKNPKTTIVDDAHSALVHLDQQSAYQSAQREKLAAIGEAVAKINHDMRNVLSAATLVTDSLVSSKDPAVAAAAPKVTRAIDRAVALCQEMLTYLNAPPKLKRTPTNMEALLGEVQQSLAVAVTVEYHGPDELCVDGGQFFRLMFNLVDNAGKAGARLVSVRSKRELNSGGGGIVMDIVDDGAGMDAATKARLFKPFQSKNGSSGLGLSIARDIALAHGGGLSLVRTSKMGSVFRLTLPAQVLVKTNAPANKKAGWWHKA